MTDMHSSVDSTDRHDAGHHGTESHAVERSDDEPRLGDAMIDAQKTYIITMVSAALFIASVFIFIL